MYRLISVGLSIVLIVAFMASTSCSSGQGEIINSGEAGTRVGDTAPDFTLTDLDGNQVSLSDLRGKVVFLNFWATWCPPCRAEMPDIEAVYQKYKDQDVVILGIDIQESESRVRQFVEVDNDYNWTFLLDGTGVVSNAYEVTSIPYSFFIDTTGVIKATQIGAMSMSRMESLLAKAR